MLKLVRFVPFKDCQEVWHIFVAQRWEKAAPGSAYLQEFYIDTLCARATTPTDPKAKSKFIFAPYDKAEHSIKKMCAPCIKKFRASRPVPIAKLRGFHE